LDTPIVGAFDLLSYWISQAFAVTIVIFVGKGWARLGQPLITDNSFERAALPIDRPYALARCETTEPAAATAASVD
jgi:hypothetical protein